MVSPVVLAQAVERVSAQHRHAQRRDVGELDGVVLAGADGFGQVESDLLGVDVEGGDEFDVPHVIVTELHVHEPGHAVVDRRVTIVVNALHERGRAVPDAHDADSNCSHGVLPSASEICLPPSRGLGTRRLSPGMTEHCGPPVWCLLGVDEVDSPNRVLQRSPDRGPESVPELRRAGTIRR